VWKFAVSDGGKIPNCQYSTEQDGNTAYSRTTVENLKQFAFKADKSRVVRRTFWLIKVVPTWKKFEKRCSDIPTATADIEASYTPFTSWHRTLVSPTLSLLQASVDTPGDPFVTPQCTVVLPTHPLHSSSSFCGDGGIPPSALQHFEPYCTNPVFSSPVHLRRRSTSDGVTDLC
jgi:hypothetical protein